MNLPRWLNPKTNPALYSALLGLAYAVWQAEAAASAHGPFTWQRAGHVAAGVAWAFAMAYMRHLITPVADPKDGNGKPLAGVTAAEKLRLSRAELEALANVNVVPVTYSFTSPATGETTVASAAPPDRPPAGSKP